MSEKEKKTGVVTASAGNHAQRVAFSCEKLKIEGTIFMPETTTRQKIERVRYFGGDYIKIKIIGKNFDESTKEAIEFSKKTGAVFISVFNDIKIIAGRGLLQKKFLTVLVKRLTMS